MINKETFIAVWNAETQSKTPFTEAELEVLYEELIGFETSDGLMQDPHTLSMFWSKLTEEELVRDYDHRLESDERYVFNVSVEDSDEQGLHHETYDYDDLEQLVPDFVSNLEKGHTMTIEKIDHPELINNLVSNIGYAATIRTVDDINFIVDTSVL